MPPNANYSQRQFRLQQGHGGVGRMFLLSLALHGLVLLAVGGFLTAPQRPPSKPVYYVDLLQKPVVKPRAGRPDAKPVTPKKVAKPAAAKEKKVTTPVAATKKPAVAPSPSLPKTPPAAPVVVKPVASAAKPLPPKTVAPKTVAAVDEHYHLETQDAIEELRRKQRIAELKNQLNALASQPSPATSVAAAPLGEIGGRGSESGVDFGRWINTFLSASWSLPSHYHNRGLSARILLRFDSQGRLRDYEMLRASGDSFFDASVRRAVEQLQQLPSPPGKPLELTVTFDPKEMLRP